MGLKLGGLAGGTGMTGLSGANGLVETAGDFLGMTGRTGGGPLKACCACSGDSGSAVTAGITGSLDGS